MAYSDIKLPSFVAYGILGLLNGGVLGGLERAFGIPYYGFIGKALLYGASGMISLGFVDLIGLAFPSWNGAQSNIVQGKIGAGLFAYLGSLAAAGAVNGWTFWMLMGFSVFRNAGWLGTMVAGVISLTFYSLVVNPILQAVFGSAPATIDVKEGEKKMP